MGRARGRLKKKKKRKNPRPWKYWPGIVSLSTGHCSVCCRAKSGWSSPGPFMSVKMQLINLSQRDARSINCPLFDFYRAAPLSLSLLISFNRERKKEKPAAKNWINLSKICRWNIDRERIATPLAWIRISLSRLSRASRSFIAYNGRCFTVELNQKNTNRNPFFLLFRKIFCSVSGRRVG